jgi:hypothetical protein
MRSLILRAIAALLALALCAGGVAAQGKKKKKRAAAKTSAAKTSSSGPSSAKTPTEPYTGDPTPPPQAPERGDGVRRITPLEARAAQEKGTAIIVDVRNEQAYMAGHIKGASLIPFQSVAGQLDKLPRNKMIITYCS